MTETDSSTSTSKNQNGAVSGPAFGAGSVLGPIWNLSKCKDKYRFGISSSTQTDQYKTVPLAVESTPVATIAPSDYQTIPQSSPQKQ